MALELRAADWPVAEAVTQSLAHPPAAVYRRTDRGYQPLDTGDFRTESL
jgi:hypothetical protein